MHSFFDGFFLREAFKSTAQEWIQSGFEKLNKIQQNGDNII